MSLCKLLCPLGALLFCFFCLLHPTNSFGQNCDCVATLEITPTTSEGCCVTPVFGKGCVGTIDFDVTFDGLLLDDQDSYCWSENTGNSGYNKLWTLSVTDANGCTAYDSAIISEDCMDTCDDCTVQFEVNNCCMFSVAYGCQDPVTYQWTLDGQPFQIPLGNDHGCGDLLPPGNYAVTATDANGCTATDEIVLPENWCECFETDGCGMDFVKTKDCELIVCATCAGVNTFYMTRPDGSETSWSVAPWMRPCRVFDIDLDGEYCVTLVNSDGCEYTECVTLEGCCELEAVEIVGLNCINSGETLYATNPNGGFSDFCNTANYLVEWSDGSTGCSISCVCGSTRTVTVTDLQTNCKVTDQYTPVSCEIGSGFRTGDDDDQLPILVDVPTSMDISPNPSRGIFNIAITSPNGLKGELTVFDAQGKVLKNIVVDGLNTDPTQTLTIDLSDFPGNLFFVNYNNGVEFSSKRIAKF